MKINIKTFLKNHPRTIEACLDIVLISINTQEPQGPLLELFFTQNRGWLVLMTIQRVLAKGIAGQTSEHG